MTIVKSDYTVVEVEELDYNVDVVDYDDQVDIDEQIEAMHIARPAFSYDE